MGIALAAIVCAGALAFLGMRLSQSLRLIRAPVLRHLSDQAVLLPIPPPVPGSPEEVRRAWAAIDPFRPGVRYQSKDPGDWLALARQARVAGDFVTARTAYMRALQASPRCDLQAYDELGEVDLALGLLREALATYRKLEAQAPSEAVGYIGESRTLLAMGRDAEGRLALERGSRHLAPGNVPGHLGLSVLFDGELQFSAAFREAELARAAAPRDPNVLLSLATLYRKHHRLAEARSLATQVVQMLPDAPEGHRVLAEALDDAADPHRDRALAESHYLEALDRDPHDQKALEELGKLYLEENRLRPALYVYTLLLRERPNDGQARLVIAQGYDRLGDRRTAGAQRVLGYRLAALGNQETALIAAREQDPQDARRRIRLADLLMQEGRYREGLVELEAAFCLRPASPEVRQLLAGTFRKLSIPLPPWLHIADRNRSSRL